MAEKRFNKQKVVDYINRRMHELEALHGFAPNDGWQQVTGLEESVLIAYGVYSELFNIKNALDL